MKLIVLLLCAVGQGLALLSKTPEWPDYSQPPRMAVQWPSDLYPSATTAGVQVSGTATEIKVTSAVSSTGESGGASTDYQSAVLGTPDCTSPPCSHQDITVRDPDNAVQLISQTKITKAINIYTELAKKVADEIREEAWKKVQTDAQGAQSIAPPNIIFDQFSRPVPAVHHHPRPVPSVERLHGVDPSDLSLFLQSGILTLEQLEATPEEIEDVYEHDVELVHKAATKKIIYEELTQEGLTGANPHRVSIVQNPGNWNGLSGGRRSNRTNRRLLTKHRPQKEAKPKSSSEITPDDSQEKSAVEEEKSTGLLGHLGNLWNSISDGLVSMASAEHATPSMIGLP